MRKEWNELLHKSFSDTIFLSWEKMAPSVRYLSKNKTLKILCAKEKNTILGIAPLRKSRRMYGQFIGYDVIEPLAYGNTDYSGMILSERKAECLQTFLTHLFSKKDWDLMYLQDIPQSSPLLDLLTQHRFELPNFRIEQGIICPYLPIPSSMDELLNSLDSKFHKSLRRCMRKLEREKGKVELKEYHELFSLEDAVQFFFDIHQRRWETKSKPSAFSDPMFRKIFLDTAKFFHEKDWVKFYFLTVNEKPAATLFTLQYNNKVFGNFCGFDPAYSNYGVGNLLMMKVFERCVENKVKEYDFMHGDEPYKFKWTKNFRRNVNVKFANYKPSSRLLALGMVAAERARLTGLLEKSLAF